MTNRRLQKRANKTLAKQRVCVLVLGMHRSGTSALTRLLSIAGASLPASLMRESPANVTGFWESVSLMKYHESLLAEMGSHWNDWRGLELSRVPVRRRREIKSEILGILEAEYGDAPLFAVKDPRICRFPGLFLEALHEATIEVRPVLPIRNPLEVADSLQRKYGTISRIEGGLLWLRHVLEAEAATRGRPRAIVSYENLVIDWRTCFERLTHQTHIVWPYTADDIDGEVTRFLNHGQRHHAHSTEDVLLDPALRHWIGEAYSALLVLEGHPESTAGLAKLDSVRSEFSHAAPILHELLEQSYAKSQLTVAETLSRGEAEAKRLAEKLGLREAEANKLNAALGAAEATRKKLAEKLDQREAEAKELKVSVGAVSNAADELAQALGRRDVEASELKTALGAAEARANDLAQALARREALAEEERAARDRRIGEIESHANELVACLAARQRQLDRLKKSAAWRMTAPFRAVGSGLAALPQLPRRFRASKRLRRDAALISGSGLFGRELYLAQNPDVAKSGVDPVMHYLRYGAAEGRNPGADFDTRWYLAQNPDVAAAGNNPLVHFIAYGRAEGRLPLPPEPPNENGASQGREANENGAQAERQETPPAPVFDPPAEAAHPVSFPFAVMAEVAWVRHGDLTRTSDSLALELSGVLLGTASMPPVDAGDPWPSFAVPARALTAFCRMLALDARQVLRCCRGDSPCEAAPASDFLPAAFPILSFEDAEAEVTLTDLWFSSDFDLKLRFESARDAAEPSTIARLYQYDVSEEPQLLMLGEAPVSGAGLDVIGAGLANPFLPLLITLTTPGGNLIAASLLPFPSLCRGGAHYGELCALGTGGSYFESLRDVSRLLLAELLGEGAASPGFSVAKLNVDLQAATGAERIFSAAIRDWMAAVMVVELGPKNSATIPNHEVASYLERTLAPPPPASRIEIAERILARKTGGVLDLTLPADAIPTLHALVSRQLAVPAGQSCAVGSFIVAEDATATPEWAVKVPPLGEELLALQPAGAPAGYPVLRGRSPSADEADKHGVASIPLAVRFCDTRSRPEAKLLMPLAADVAAPLLRRSISDAAARTLSISVLLPSCDSDAAAFAAFLESLALQSVADEVDIIAMADASRPYRTQPVREALQDFFAGRYVVLDAPVAANRQERINRAAQHGAGRFLLIADAGLVLHDARTLEVLCLLADEDKVASAGCMLVGHRQSKKGHQVIFRSAGVFPAEGSHPGGFRELDCHGALPLATYPVAANSPSLFMVRADVWRSLGGLDASITPDSHAHVRYALKAISEGFVHFCTSAVSAGRDENVNRGPGDGEVVSIDDLAARAHPNIASSAVILEALRG